MSIINYILIVVLLQMRSLEVVYLPHPLNPPLLEGEGERLFLKGRSPFNLPPDKQPYVEPVY